MACSLKQQDRWVFFSVWIAAPLGIRKLNIWIYCNVSLLSEEKDSLVVSLWSGVKSFQLCVWRWEAGRLHRWCLVSSGKIKITSYTQKLYSYSGCAGHLKSWFVSITERSVRGPQSSFFSILQDCNTCTSLPVQDNHFQCKLVDCWSVVRSRKYHFVPSSQMGLRIHGYHDI